MTFRSFAALSLALLAFMPTSALAEEVEPPRVKLEGSRISVTKPPALDSLTLKLECEAPDPELENRAPEGTPCTGTVSLYVSTQPYYWRGKWTKVGSAALSVPVGKVSVVVPTPSLRLRLSKAGSLTVKAKLVDVDGEEHELSTESRPSNEAGHPWPSTLPLTQFIASEASCGIPALYAYKSRKTPIKLTSYGFEGESYDQREPETNKTRLDKRHWYVARATTTIKMNGLTHTINKGSQFAMQCVRSTSSGNKLVPVLYLMHGKARVQGVPNARQRVTGIQAPPGLFSTSSRARADFTVTTNGNVKLKRGQNPLKKINATVRSKLGTITAYQRIKMDPTAHCTPGKGVFMRLDGYTKAIR